MSHYDRAMAANAGLRKRIRRLEATNAGLRQWNERLRRRLRPLPHFDMADPQIVEKLLATTKGTK